MVPTDLKNLGGEVTMAKGLCARTPSRIVLGFYLLKGSMGRERGHGIPQGRTGCV